MEVETSQKDKEAPTNEDSIKSTAGCRADNVDNGVVGASDMSAAGVSGDTSDGVKVSSNDGVCDTGANMDSVKSDSVTAVKDTSGGGLGEKGEGDRVTSELEKQLWVAVTTNPSDFARWTSLLQMTEQNVCIYICHSVYMYLYMNMFV